MPQTSPSAAGDGIAEFYGWASEDGELFEWTVGSATGITDGVAVAAGHVQEELERAPVGAVGSVHRVIAVGEGYQDTGMVAHARRAADGGVVWQGGQGPLEPGSGVNP